MKTNRNYLLILSMLFATIVLCGACMDNAKSKLRKSVEKANRECPQNLGMIGSMTELGYDENHNEVDMVVSISKGMPMNISALKENKNIVKQTFLSSVAASSSKNDIFKMIEAADAAFRIILKHEASNEKIDILLTKDDVRMLANGEVPILSAKELLQMNVTITNSACPVLIDESTTLTGVYMDGNDVVYCYSIDESEVSIAELQEYSDAFETLVRANLSSNDPSIKSFVDRCKEVDNTIYYLYEGDTTGESFALAFNASEL